MSNEKYYVPHGTYWPIIGSIGISTLFIGFANQMHDVSWGWPVMVLGFAIIAFMMFGWLGTVVAESVGGMYNSQVDKSFRWGMSWFIFSEVSSVDNHLVLPVDTTVRFLITSNDVIHNWWVPAFGVKQDANPGFINDAWAKPNEIGTYRGQCAELCGKDHGFMPIVVDVVSKADYAAWVESKQAEKVAELASATKEWTEADLVARGEEVQIFWVFVSLRLYR